MTAPSRRSLIRASGLAVGALALFNGAARGQQAFRSAPDPHDEAAWARVRALYDLPPGVIQLENGNWGVMARPVLQAYVANQRRVNRDGSYYARRDFARDIAAVRARLAAALGVEPEEIAFTRNATEALQALIAGYAKLRAGDQVLLADLDYDSMQTAMRWLTTRRGVGAVEIALPEPATHQGLIDAYEAALVAHPKVRLMLLTHVSHRTGLVLPVREIIAMARSRGVDVILDSAHAWGQLDFRLPELGADFVGLNLHKWIGAPLGVGAMVIRRQRLEDIEPFMGEPDPDGPSIEARVHTGTTNFAAYLTVPDALNLREQIGASAIEARLRALRTGWAEPLRHHPGIEILTPPDPRLFAGITSFRLRGQTTPAQNRALAQTLLDRFGVFTVARSGVAAGACVRVTPGVFTTMAEIAALRDAVRSLAAGASRNAE